MRRRARAGPAAAERGHGGTGTTPTGDYVPPNDSDDWETAEPEANGWSPSGLDDLLAVVEANHSSSFMMCSP
ncbi:MAG: hypothetical protein KC731_23935 [Myxococcales bacterium]|nr:hypothetical protein [Myxococcales bacterium]